MRRKLLSIHRYLAVISLIPLLLITLTGGLLVFKTEIDSILMPDTFALESVGSQRMEIDVLKNSLNQHFPEYEIGAWEIFENDIQADRVYLIKKGTENWFKIFFDPYESQILSEPVANNHYLTDWLLELHYTLLLNDVFESAPLTGMIIAAIIAAFLIIIGISGLILYKSFWKKFFVFKWQGTPLAVLRSFHRSVGIWSAPVFLIIGITGLYYNIVFYLEELHEHEEPHHIVTERLYSNEINFQSILKDSQTQIKDFKPTYLLFPYEPEVPITVYGKVPTYNPFSSDYSSTVTYDRLTGKHLQNNDIRDSSFLMKLVDSFRELHFGSFGGLASKIIWTLVSLGIVFLAFSGIMTWLKPKHKKLTVPNRIKG